MPLAPNHERPWREWYQLERWRRLRRHQLRKAPLCELCLKLGKLERASIADHIVSHKGDWNRFWLGELQSLCKPCHDSRKKLVDLRGYDPTIGDDGWPIDQRHPVYR